MKEDTTSQPQPLHSSVETAIQPVQDQGKAGVHMGGCKAVSTKFKGWMLVVLALMTLAGLIGTAYLLISLPKQALAIQKLRSQSLSQQISGQDTKVLEQTVKDTQSQRNELITAFPKEAELVSFIQKIDVLKDMGVTVLQFSVDSDKPTKIGKNPSFLPMTLRLKGSPEAVNSALEYVTNQHVIIRPVTFIKDYDAGGKQVVVSTQFHLFVADAFK